jgi:threonine/homoserine/homoserine lactone efflux protein
MEFIVAGAIVGLTAGFLPGPLMVLVMGESLRYGTAAGVRTSFAPLVTDAPLIAAALLLTRWVSDLDKLSGVIALVGAGVVTLMAVDSMRARAPQPAQGEVRRRSLLRGAVVNATSPHPYLFWFTVGGPTILRASEAGLVWAVAFVAVFFTGLVGGKIVVATVAGRSRRFISGGVYRWVTRLLGVLLLGFAALLLWDGLRLLRVVGDVATR